MNPHRSPINPRAVMLGYITDMCTTKIFEFSLVLVLLDPGSSSASPLERINPQLLDSFLLLWGLFFTVLGGFVAARLAPAHRTLHASLAGLLSTLTALAMYGFMPQEGSLVLYYIGLLGTIPAALAGGKMAGWWDSNRA